MKQFIICILLMYAVFWCVRNYDLHVYNMDRKIIYTDTPGQFLDTAWLREQQDDQDHIYTDHSKLQDSIIITGLPHLPADSIIVLFGNRQHSVQYDVICQPDSTGIYRVSDYQEERLR